MSLYALILIAALWIACGALAYAGTLAYHQREWPEISQYDRSLTCAVAVFGLIGGPITFAAFALVFDLKPFKHGLMWRLPKEGP